MEGKLRSDVDETDVKPSDSISNAGVKEQASVASSRISKSRYRSKSSSAMGARLTVMARKAAIEAEKVSFVKQQALEHKKLKLKHKNRESRFDIQLAKAEAEERVYNETMLKLPMSPTKSNEDQKNRTNTEPQPKLKGLSETNINLDAPEWTSQPTRDKLNPNRHERQSEASSEVVENFLRNMVDIQQ